MYVSDKNFITIQGWMLRLGIKGNELLAYALVYCFSQDNNSKFNGSLTYIQEWLQSSRNTAISTMRSLEEKGLIIKKQEENNRVITNYYVAVVPPNGGSAKNELPVQNLSEGSANSAPNNKIYNKNSSRSNTISLHSSPTLTSSPTTTTSTITSTTSPQPPEGACVCGKEKKELDLSFIGDFRFRGMMRRWFDFRKEMRRPFTQTGAEQCYKNLLEMSKQDPSIAQKIIDQSIGNNWQGLFPLKAMPNGNYNSTSTAGSNWTTEFRRAVERQAGIIK